jgi:hypothetical protein
MSETRYRIEIDRIILEGLDFAPARAEGIRRLIEAELHALLVRGDVAQVAGSSEAVRLAAPTMGSGDLRSDRQLASALARSVAQAVRVAAEPQAKE